MLLFRLSLGLFSFLLLFFLLIDPLYAQTTFNHFKIAPGNSDVIPHQIVRAKNDKVYVFAGLAENSGKLVAYWTQNSGLPNVTSDFSNSTQQNFVASIISTEAAYDGDTIIHVITNTSDGMLVLSPFDTNTNSFKIPKGLANAMPSSVTNIGTSGVSAMVDKNKVVHVAYWGIQNTIFYISYTYDPITGNVTHLTSPFKRVDAAYSANHPALSVSPVDGSVTIAWVSEATTPKKILARTKSADGTWSAIETVSTAPVWVSTDAGINIDQGPSLLIDSNGVKHIAYIEDWRVTAPYDYGRIHYATNSGNGWVDTYIGAYSHDPALAINSANEMYIIGHGYPLNSLCTSVDDMCVIKKNSNGTWANPQLFATHPPSGSFDASPSVKYGAVGWYRPETIEFVFFQTPYSTPTLWYGNIMSPNAPTATPNVQPTNTPTPKKLGDVDGNGVVDLFDFNEVVGYFGTVQTNPFLDADLDKSGEVDLYDFNEVVANFSLD